MIRLALTLLLAACGGPDPLAGAPSADSTPSAQPTSPGGGGPADDADLAVGEPVVSEAWTERDLVGVDTLTLSSDAPFASVGLRFDRNGTLRPQLELRAGSGDTWSDWSSAEITWAAEVAANAAWAPELPAHRLEVRGDLGALAHLVVELFPHERPTPTTGGHRGAAPPPPDAIVGDRASWGARGGTCHLYLPRHTPARITVHHTVTPTIDPLSPEARLQQIQAYHMDSNGWCDIGYHYVVSGDGRLWQGAPDPLREGIHTGGANHGNLGVAVLGSYHLDHPSGPTLDGLAAMIASLGETFAIPLDAAHVHGHREFSATECPGGHLYDALPLVIDMAAGAAGPAPATALCAGAGEFYCGACPSPVPVEDYIAQVVTCENGAASLEALKAQAIAARSYLHYALEAGGAIADSEAGQVYSCGRGASPDAVAATSATAGQVLVNELDQTLAAFYVAGAIPDPPVCLPGPLSPDPTGTERWVTYQDPSRGPIPSPLGSLVNPKNRGCKSQNGADCVSDSGGTATDVLNRYYAYSRVEVRDLPCDGAGGGAPPGASCPVGDGLYCGSHAGLDPGALYWCGGGAWSLRERCASGCTVNPPGVPDACAEAGVCPSGDGRYCGGGVGLHGGTLYDCVGGVFTVAEVCAHGCDAMPPGVPDACASAACPYGDGAYCGGPVGLDPNTLYDCVGGAFSPREACAAGCDTMPPGIPDACASAACPYGDGAYCGGPVGLDANTLYDCVGGAFSPREACAAGCDEMPPGIPDACASAACPYGDGHYCGDDWGLAPGALYWCAGGGWTVDAECAAGCVTAPPGDPDYCAAGVCPYGDGAYCGGGVGLDPDVLYDCIGGTYWVDRECPGDCVVAPPGLPDYCR